MILNNIDKTMKKYLIGSFFVITAATVAGLYIYNNILMKQQLQQIPPHIAEVSTLSYTPSYTPSHTIPSLHDTNYINYIDRTNNMAIQVNSEYMLPRLMMDVTTCEYDDKTKKWTPVITHTVYGDTREEMYGIIESHQKTDAFFAASFTGKFEWKGGIIKLKNIVSDVMYTY